MAKRPLQRDDEFSLAKAMQIRESDALKDYNLPARIAEIVACAEDRVGLNPTVEHMWELGGYTAVIQSIIGPQPAAQPNKLGFPTNPAYHRWNVLMRQVPEIINTVKRRVTR